MNNNYFQKGLDNVTMLCYDAVTVTMLRSNAAERRVYGTTDLQKRAAGHVRDLLRGPVPVEADGQEITAANIC